MPENTDQKNAEYGHFLRSVALCRIPVKSSFSMVGNISCIGDVIVDAKLTFSMLF